MTYLVANATEKEKSKFIWCDQIKAGKIQRQQNLINDLITAADGLQNLNTNAITQQLQNTQQHEYLRQAFPTTRPATNLGAPSNETNSNIQQLQNTQQHEYLRQAFPTTPPAANRAAPSNKSTNLLFFIVFVIFIFSLLFFVGTSFSV